MTQVEESAYWKRKFAGLEQVEQMEIDRAMRMSPTKKLEELARLFELARLLPNKTAKEAELAIVRDRWRRLKGVKKKN